MFSVHNQEQITYLKMARTLLGKPLRTAYAFVVDGLVVDGGPTNFRESIRDYFSAHPPQQAVFTHHHEDHAGNIDIFNQLGITPFAHPEAVELLHSKTSIPYYRRFTWGNPANGLCRNPGNVIETAHYTFQVIPSPGHSTDHIALYEKNEGWLFTGDLFVSERIQYLYESENIASMKQSLLQLSKLDFSTLCCSHRGPLKKGPEALLRKLHFIEALEGKVSTLQQQGCLPNEITRRLLGKEDYMYVISRGEFSKTAFINALLSQDKQPSR
jgi:glyoxylase-like metal-dependent hydrolase (beta-lactamase superfamily II)